MIAARGVTVDRTFQLKTGGHIDFMNMLDRQRLGSKKESKTEAVQAMLAQQLIDETIRWPSTLGAPCDKAKTARSGASAVGLAKKLYVFRLRPHDAGIEPTNLCTPEWPTRFAPDRGGSVRQPVRRIRG